MGYSHYFHQNRDFTQKEWSQITQAFSKMLANLPPSAAQYGQGGGYEHYPLSIAGFSGSGEPRVDGEKIAFNGGGGLDGEAFELYRVAPTKGKFAFIKTRRKPYDLVVTALLITAAAIAPDAITVSSDGDTKDWEPARRWLRDIGLKSVLGA